MRRASFRAIAILLLALLSAPALVAEAGSADSGLTVGETVGTALLAAPVLARAVAPLVLLGSELAGGHDLQIGVALSALWTVPNGVLAWDLLHGDAAGVRFWRRVNLAVDGLGFAVLAGGGAWLMTHPTTGENWNDLIGAIFIVASVPFGVSFGIDWIPFPVESRASR